MSALAELGAVSTISLRGPRSTIRWPELWVLLAVFAMALVLRVALLGSSGLWADEVFSLALATGHSLEHPAPAARPELGDFVEPDHPVSAEEFSRYVKHQSPLESPARVVRAVLLSDTNPPLYYLLLYIWTLLLGTGDVALRSFSIACSLACLPLLVGVARRTGGKGAILPVSVLFAFSPFWIYYSTEGRMYSLLLFCVLATAWLSLALCQGREGIALRLLWIVASAAGLLTHYFFVFPWVAMVAFLVIRPGKFERRHLFLCILLTAALVLPCYAQLRESAGNWRITQEWLKLGPEHFHRLVPSLQLVVQSFSGRAKELWLGYRPFYIGALILFGIVAFAMFRRLRIRAFGGPRLLLWLSFAATCAGPVVIDLMQHTYLVIKPRYAIAALPAAYLLAAVGLACLRPRIRIVLLILIVLVWTPTIMNIYHNRLPWLPMREIARVASADSRASDLILVHSIPSGVINIARYANGSALIASWVGQLKNRQVPESLEQLGGGRVRILFVKIHDVGEPAPEEDWLRANAVVFQEMHLGVGTVVDFRPKIAETF
jgi:hypothetical protein